MNIGTAVYVTDTYGVDDETIFYYLGDDPNTQGHCLIGEPGDCHSARFSVPRDCVHALLQSESR